MNHQYWRLIQWEAYRRTFEEVCEFTTISVRYSVLTPILKSKSIRRHYIMDRMTTHHLDGGPKSVRGSTGFTPICPGAVGLIALSWFPRETVGCMKQRRLTKGTAKRRCMVWFRRNDYSRTIKKELIRMMTVSYINSVLPSVTHSILQSC